MSEIKTKNRNRGNNKNTTYDNRIKGTETLLLHYCVVIDKTLRKYKIFSKEDLIKAMQRDIMLRSHICMYAGQIGELSKQEKEIEKRYPKIAWKKIQKLRNCLFHNYDAIPYSLISSVVIAQISPLREALKRKNPKKPQHIAVF